MAGLRHVLSRLRHEESGVSIIEVLVSAVLLAIIAVGVLKGLDAANAASGNSKNRAIAADLASQDQERMRAFRAKDLSNMNLTYQRTVAGVRFDITSTAQWVNDGSGSRRCGQATGRADYLKIASTVTWERMLRAAPVTQTSLYAPPNGSFGDQGSLGVEVLDRNAVGVPGVSVSAAGPTNVSGTTDSAGCVFFSFLPQGNYTTSISKPGYVDRNGNSVITSVFGVQGGSTQVQPVDYDLAGAIQANVRTKWKGVNAYVTAAAQYLTVGHSQIQSPNVRIFGNGTSLTTLAAPGLFPFTSAYSAYSGNCTKNDPSDTTQGYGATKPTVVVTPGGNSAVNVDEAALQIKRFTSNNSNSGTSANLPQGTPVTLTSTTAGCPAVVTTHTVDSNGWLAPAGAAAADSIDPAMPFGDYTVCASVGGRKRIRTGVRLALNAATPTGTSVTLPNLNNDPSGSCP